MVSIVSTISVLSAPELHRITHGKGVSFKTPGDLKNTDDPK